MFEVAGTELSAARILARCINGKADRCARLVNSDDPSPSQPALTVLDLDGLLLIRLRAKQRRERWRKAREGQEDEDGKDAIEQRALPIQLDTH